MAVGCSSTSAGVTIGGGERPGQQVQQTTGGTANARGGNGGNGE